MIKLEHRLEAYRRIVADIPRVEEGVRSNVAMIKQASAKLHEKKQQLVQLEANLNSRNQHNNEVTRTLPCLLIYLATHNLTNDL